MYETLGGKCFWCGEPFGLIDCTVDHVIPESVDTVEYTDLRTHYGLHEDFEINNFYNWVPSHLKCNQSKSNRLFAKSPAFIKVFEDLAKNAPQAAKVSERIDNNKPTAKKLSELYVWISKKTLSSEEVATLMELLEEFYAEVPSEIPPEEGVVLAVVPDVSVMRSKGSTKIIPLGTFIRSPDADAQLVVGSLGNGQFSIRLGFLGKDYFSLSKGARWQFDAANVIYDDANLELQFQTDLVNCEKQHSFHLAGPSVFNDTADSLDPAYGASIKFHEEAAIIAENSSLGIFSSGRTFAGTYLRGYGTKIEIVQDNLGISAMTNVHPNPDPSWECPHCGGNVWSGVQCRQCGMLVDPWD